MELLKVLAKRKINVRSPSSAVQDLTQHLEYDINQYRSLYNELTDSKTSLSDDEITYHTRYLVSEIVRANRDGEPLEIDTLVRDSGILATTLLNRINFGDLKYVKSANLKSENSDNSENSNLSANSTSRKLGTGINKKGAKKRIAEDTYRQMHKTSTREEIIKVFIEHGFNEQSANSYYYMCSRKFGKPESEIGKKSKRGHKSSNGVKKGDLAAGIYRQHYLSVPKEELIKILAREMNITEKDAVGYYYVGRRIVGVQSENLCPNQKKRNRK